MEYTKLGQSDLEISRICLGCMGFGDLGAGQHTWTVGEEATRVIECVAELADRRGVSMTEVSLAWLLTKVAAPIVGATKLHHVDGAAAAVNLALSEEEIAYLEESYVPHAIVGVMAQNKPADSGKEHVWLANAKYLKTEKKS